ncbi:hypothetical protein CTA2_4894 [Colletotrichum tanaceti]|nr:hypothetical protein CTA2_4894 [Colletotrichum tanaceti]
MQDNGKDVKPDAHEDKEKREKPEHNGGHAHPVKSPKKRRKVNHGTFALCPAYAGLNPSSPVPRPRDYTAGRSNPHIHILTS